MLRKTLMNEIREQLRRSGAGAGEILTELVRLERASIDGLKYYLQGLREERAGTTK